MRTTTAKFALVGMVLGLTAACENREYKTIVSSAQPQVAEPTRPLLMQKPGSTECTPEFIEAAVEIMENSKNLKLVFESEDFVKPDVVLERAVEVVDQCQDLFANLVENENGDSCQIPTDGSHTEINLSVKKVKEDCKSASDIQKALQAIVK